MSKPRAILPQMPWNVTSKIVDYMHFPTRVHFRMTRKEYRQLVNRRSVTYESIIVKAILKTELVMIVTDQFGEYAITYRGVGNDNFLQDAVGFLILILKHHGTSIKSLKIFHDPYWYLWSRFGNWPDFGLFVGLKNFLQVFKNMIPHRLTVEKLIMEECWPQDDIISLLQCFRPRTLKLIDVTPTDPFSIDRVVSLDEWRQAECIKARNICGFSGIDVSSHSHIRIAAHNVTHNALSSIIEKMTHPTRIKKTLRLALNRFENGKEGFHQVMRIFNTIPARDGYFIVCRNRSQYLSIFLDPLENDVLYVSIRVLLDPNEWPRRGELELRNIRRVTFTSNTDETDDEEIRFSDSEDEDEEDEDEEEEDVGEEEQDVEEEDEEVQDKEGEDKKDENDD